MTAPSKCPKCGTVLDPRYSGGQPFEDTGSEFIVQPHTLERCLDVVIGQRDEAIRVADRLLMDPNYDFKDATAALERLRGGRG